MTEEKIMYTYILKCVNADMTSYGGFVWPKGGIVTCPDWSPEAVCGKGLHGWAKGEGDSNVAQIRQDSRWLVVKVRSDRIVDLAGKVKFPRGRVVFCGNRDDATAYILKKHPGAVCNWATVTGGSGATVTGGDYAKVTGGDRATVTGGDCATVTGGDGATVTGGHGASVTGGSGATVTGGHGASVTGGSGATVTGGLVATVTGGNCATVTGGDCAKVTGGDWATVTGGHGAVLSLYYYEDRKRIVTAYVGENGIEAGVAYKLDSNHQFVRA